MSDYADFWRGWSDKEFEALPRGSRARRQEQRRRYELVKASFADLPPAMEGEAVQWLQRAIGAYWPGDDQVRWQARNICAFWDALPRPLRFPSDAARWPRAHCGHVLLRTPKGGYRQVASYYNSLGGWCPDCGDGARGCCGALDHQYAVTAAGVRILIGQPYWTITEPRHARQSQERYESNRQHGREACAQLDAYLRDELDGQVTALYLRDEDSWWSPPSSALLLLVNTAELPPIAAALRGAGLLPDQAVAPAALSSGNTNNA